MHNPVYLGLFGIFILLPTNCQIIFDGGEDWYNQKNLHIGKDLYVKDLETLSSLSDIENFKNILRPIMVRRVPGTPTHTAVREYIIKILEGLDWAVQTYPFSDTTPHGKKNFVNIVASYNPNALRKLIVACHYDSKFFSEDSTFIGATDSAVPCAMMLDMAVHLTPLMLKNNSKSSDLTLELVFFDGEEAFKDWTHTDSIYGARFLAQKWSNTPSPTGFRDGTNYLHQIDMLILLDLLGARSPQFYNFFENTQGWYAKLVQIENEMRTRGLMTPGRAFFQPKSTHSFIEDDHIPFLERGVKILHLIPNPFPSVWHRDSDDWSALDFPTIDGLNKILRSFIAMYLRLAL